MRSRASQWAVWLVLVAVASPQLNGLLRAVGLIDGGGRKFN